MAIQQLSAAKLKKMLDEMEQAGLDLFEYEILVSERVYDDSPMDIPSEKTKPLTNNFMLDKTKQIIVLYLN